MKRRLDDIYQRKIVIFAVLFALYVVVAVVWLV